MAEQAELGQRDTGWKGVTTEQRPSNVLIISCPRVSSSCLHFQLLGNGTVPYMLPPLRSWDRINFGGYSWGCGDGALDTFRQGGNALHPLVLDTFFPPCCT